MLTQAELQAILEYNANTGIFTWKIKPRHSKVSIGQSAGCLNRGYVIIVLNGKAYQAHRLAWLYEHNILPETCMDHINGVKNDNRLLNLRLATVSENSQNIWSARKNSSHGFLGVSKYKDKWQARIMTAGVRTFIGWYSTAEQAHAAYITAKSEQHVVRASALGA